MCGFSTRNSRFSGFPPIVADRVIDTLALARRKFPGAANSLDALCVRYGIDTSRRTKHGALLDAEILADVYAELSAAARRISSLAKGLVRPAVAEPAFLRKGRARSPRGSAMRNSPVIALLSPTLGAAPLWNAYFPPDASAGHAD